MNFEISTKMMQVGDMEFEIDICGDQTSEKLALFLHGFPETPHAWRHQMPLLAKMGYKCWAPSQRGYGKTSSPKAIASYKMELLVDDVAKIIDEAKCKSVTLIGHDWGAAVAWQFALKLPRPLDKLIIMNVPHPAIFALEIKKFRQLKKSWYMFFFQLPKLPEYLLTRNNAEAIEKLMHKSFVDKTRISQYDIEVYRKNALRPDGMNAMLNWYRAAFRALRTNANFKIIEIPTLLIWGEQDSALGINLSKGTEKYVKDFTLQYIPDAGHFVQEDNPKRTNELLLAWLEKQ